MKQITELTTDLNNIQGLADKPNAESGLTPLQLKTTFDKTGNDIKAYINDTMIADIDDNFTEVVSDYATKAEVQGITLGQIPDNTITQTKLVASLQNEIEISKLSNRYSNAINTISQKVWAKPYLTSYIPDMTNNSQDGFIISATSEQNAAYLARDNSTTTYWESTGSAAVRYWQVQLPTAVAIGTVGTLLGTGLVTVDSILEASNNGTDWTSLGSIGVIADNVEKLKIVNDISTPQKSVNTYLYYRIESTSAVTAMRLSNFQIKSYAKNELADVNLITIPNNSTALVDGLIVRMKTPTLTAAIPNYLKIGSLEEKWVSGTLTAGTYQSLRYDLSTDEFIVI